MKKTACGGTDRGVLVAILTAAVLGLASGSSPLLAQTDVITVDRIEWVNPPEEPTPGVSHGTFRSPSMDREVGYTVYVPPEYDEAGPHYPVVYWLHGRNGSEADTRPAVEFDALVRAGRVEPMVLVFANGGVASGFIDNPETGVMGESVVIRELIPHIEANYRVAEESAGRGLAGYSMGGAGAVRLAIRHPLMFGSILSVAGALFGYQEIMARHFVADAELAQSHDPYPNSIDAAPRLRGMDIKLLVGSEDTWIAENRRFAAHLSHQNLFIDYQELRGVEHPLSEYLSEASYDLFSFLARGLDVSN